MRGWTVRTEAVKNGAKGIASREVYLNNESHPNHRRTEHIMPLFGNDRSMANIVYAAERYAAEQKAKGKGGRPPSTYAVEFTLNLPKGYRPTKKEWEKIVKHCVVRVASACGIAPQQLAQTTRAIVHQQQQDQSNQGTGDHCHLVIGKFCLDGTYLRNLQRKTATARIKEAFNDVSRELGYDWTQYAQLLQKQRYPNKRPVPQWKLRAARRHQELDEQEDKIHDQLIEISIIKRLKDNFSTQANKLINAIKNNNLKQQKRQTNRLTKTINELNNHNLSPQDRDDLLRLKNALKTNSNIDLEEKIPDIKRLGRQ